jgi:hypothetical protein
LLAGLCCYTNANSATITIVNTDVPGVGLNDLTPVTPVAGNPGTTLGKQALNVFNAAANYWGSLLDSDVEIRINASFAPLAPGVLGQAGPENFAFNWTTGIAPVPNRVYSIALANSLAGVDLDPARNDAVMNFSSDFTFNFEIGSLPVTGPGIDLLSVAIHEMGHGLGWVTPFPANGYSYPSPLTDDAFSAHLFDEEYDQAWSDLSATDRALSAINTGKLVWSGPMALAEVGRLTAGTEMGSPQMYAPNPFESGSSVSHWDTTLTPNELMEPTFNNVQELWMTIKGFYDTGWRGSACLKMELPANTWRMISLDCVPDGTGTVQELFGPEISAAYPAEWSMFRYRASETRYELLALSDALELDTGYWIIQKTPSTVTLDIPRSSTRSPTPKASSDDDCNSALGCRAIDLVTRPGVITWQMLGNPFNTDMLFDDVRVSAAAGSSCGQSAGCTAVDADTGDIFAGTVFSWDGSAYQTINAGAGDVIPRNAGFWARTLPGADGIQPRLQMPKDPYAGRLQ